MATLIHCPSCGSRLSVPADAGGKSARCPSCKAQFVVPDLQTILDETVACWMDLDRLHNDEELEDTAEDLAGAPDAGEQPASPPPAPPVVRADRSAGATAPEPGWCAINPHIEISGVTSSAGGSFVIDRLPEKPASDEHATVRPPVDPHRIALQIVDIGAFGVRFRFPAQCLNNANFRASMPMRGMLSGERDPLRLIARPLAWIDKATGHLINTGELEARYEIRLRASQSPREIVAAMATMDELPPPFNQPMPYFVSHGESSDAKVHCETFANPTGMQCEVVIPSLRYALDWLGRVNGVCGDDYAALELQTLKYEAQAWRAIPSGVRHRLAVWFDFQGDEEFLGYFNDSDFSKSDAGLAGLILTSRRVVWCKYHQHGFASLEEPGELVAAEDGRFADLYLRARGTRRKLVRLREDDVRTLADLLFRLGGSLQLEFESASTQPGDCADVQVTD